MVLFIYQSLRKQLIDHTSSPLSSLVTYSTRSSTSPTISHIQERSYFYLKKVIHGLFACLPFGLGSPNSENGKAESVYHSSGNHATSVGLNGGS